MRPAKAPAPAAARAAAPKVADPLAGIPADARPTDAEVPPAAGGAELTVYLNDLAMVRERRTFKLPAAFTRLTFPGVAGTLQPETALFQVLKGPPLKFVEQSFDFNLLTPAKLLEKAVGREVTVITTNPSTGAETSNRALVLSATDGLVVQMNGRIHSNPPGRIVYDGLPPGMHATPSLTMTVAGTPGQDIESELSYLTSGLSWRADYVLQYDPEGNRMDLNGWASITNTTNLDFKDAKLKLVTGQVNRETARPQPMQMKAAMAFEARTAGPMQDGVSEEGLVGNHIYTMPRPTSLAANETKQLALLSANNVAVKRENVVRSQPVVFQQDIRQRPQTTAVGIELTFKNDVTAKLGAPLPAGTVRVYSVDQQGAPQFIGEGRIEHAAEGTDVTLQAGRDFDLPVLREQLNFVRASENIILSVWRVTIRNTSARPAAVRVVEPIPGSWEITKESYSHTKTDAGTAEWALQIPQKSQVVLEYNVKSQF
ncbi:MAG: DUF4139 domain-containing protein [Rhodospirillaceae bacterium]